MEKTSEVFDKRLDSRAKFLCEIQYNLKGFKQRCPGILENLSQSGALVSLNDELELNTVLILTVESDPPEQPPVRIDVKIVRFQQDKLCDEHIFSYGCEILSHSDMP